MKYVTRVKGNEYSVLYKTNHADENVKELYDEFKFATNKGLWLSENRSRLTKLDINVDGLIEVWRNNIDYEVVTHLERTDTTVIELQDER